MKTGSAHLPLHGGRAPAWLFQRMKRLAAEIAAIIVQEFGSQEFLRRLADPYWFQAFGCVLGFDWHSSGLTTTVGGALKEGLKDVGRELGIFVCGGKGGTSRKTPKEIEEIAMRRWIKTDPQPLIYASRMSAKVDSAALQDGYALYHHNFIFDRHGHWVVIQQGMNTQTRWARRYHWLGDGLKDFVNEPHKAVCCDHTKPVLNLVAKESEEARFVSVMLSKENPEKVVNEYKKVRQLKLKASHPVSIEDIKPENLHKILETTYTAAPPHFESLLGLSGVGPKTIRALALLSELIYKKPASIHDPVRFSFAHGGKDGYPYPVNRKVYETSIAILKEALNKAKIGETEKLKAFRRLNATF